MQIRTRLVGDVIDPHTGRVVWTSAECYSWMAAELAGARWVAEIRV